MMTEKNKGSGGLSRRNLLKLVRESALALAAGYVLQGCGGSGGSSGGGAPAPTGSPTPTQRITIGVATRKQGTPNTDPSWSSVYGSLYTTVVVNSVSLGDPPKGKDLNFGAFQAIEADKAEVNIGTTITWLEVAQAPGSVVLVESFTAA